MNIIIGWNMKGELLLSDPFYIEESEIAKTSLKLGRIQTIAELDRNVWGYRCKDTKGWTRVLLLDGHGYLSQCEQGSEA